MSDLGDSRFDERVVVVTGAGLGLGRSHARYFAALGARVLVNDLGTSCQGQGSDRNIADAMVDEIRHAGGVAIANTDSVVDGHRLVEQAMDEWGRIDVLVNNAGIIRDSSFHKMADDAWTTVREVNLDGACRVTRAAWPIMRNAGYGRVVFTASAAGIYGNFGQSNYGAAKLGLYGLTRALSVEGRSKNIHVNTIAPMVNSRMLADFMPDDLRQRLLPTAVSPVVAYLCHDQCMETGGLFEVGGGWCAKVRWQRSVGKRLPLLSSDQAVESLEQVAANWPHIVDFNGAEAPQSIEDAGMVMMSRIND